MSKALHLLRSLLLVICLFEGKASAQTFSVNPDPVGLPDLENSVSPYSRIQGMQELSRQPARSAYSLKLGPEDIRLKTSYLEKQEEERILTNGPSDASQKRYFDALATYSLWNGSLLGEGEFAYSSLGLTPASEELPKLMRLGLKGKWAGMSYGADYRSADHDFLFLTGARIDHARDESQLWGEYNLGFGRIRGSLGELRETMTDTNQLNLTRTAASSFHFNQSGWNGMFYSNYSIIEQEIADNPRTLALTNGLSALYRPVTLLTLEPNLSLKEEWNSQTGMRTQTPSAGLQLSSAPFKGMQLTGRTSYARGRSEDGLRDFATVSTAAGFNLQLEKSSLSESLLSFQIEYNNQLDFKYRSLSQEALMGKLQWKIIGF
jgi:hypothetical protein